MIIITNIETMEVDADIHQIQQMYKPYEYIPAVIDGAEIGVPAEFVVENIKGRRFFKNGKEMCIGNSKQAEELIGVQFDAWSELQDRCDTYRLSSIGFQNQLEERTGTFWRRLKWLFK